MRWRRAPSPPMVTSSSLPGARTVPSCLSSTAIRHLLWWERPGDPQVGPALQPIVVDLRTMLDAMQAGIGFRRGGEVGRKGGTARSGQAGHRRGVETVG